MNLQNTAFIFDLIRDFFILGGFAFAFWLIGHLQREFSANLKTQIRLAEETQSLFLLQQKINKNTNEFLKAQTLINNNLMAKTSGIFPTKFKTDNEKLTTRDGFSQ